MYILNDLWTSHEISYLESRLNRLIKWIVIKLTNVYEWSRADRAIS